MALLSPLVSSQVAFAYPFLGPSTGGAAATTSPLTCGPNGCSAAIQATIKGTTTTIPGNQSQILPKNNQTTKRGGSSYTPPPSGCSTIWSAGNSNLRGQGAAFGSALTATCYGNGAAGNLN
jgi:hypothetical protein